MRRLYQLALALLPLLAACEANCPIHCVHTVTRYEGPMRGNVNRWRRVRRGMPGGAEVNIISSAPIVMPFTTASGERVTLICSTSDAVKLDFHASKCSRTSPAAAASVGSGQGKAVASMTWVAFPTIDGTA